MKKEDLRNFPTERIGRTKSIGLDVFDGKIIIWYYCSYYLNVLKKKCTWICKFAVLWNRAGFRFLRFVLQFYFVNKNGQIKKWKIDDILRINVEKVSEMMLFDVIWTCWRQKLDRFKNVTNWYCQRCGGWYLRLGFLGLCFCLGLLDSQHEFLTQRLLDLIFDEINNYLILMEIMRDFTRSDCHFGKNCKHWSSQNSNNENWNSKILIEQWNFKFEI